jgi:CSLREA domain-containing protein
MPRSFHQTCSITFRTAAALLALAAVLAGAPVRAAVYTVTKTADTADGACDTDCSLREAILAANANPGPDFILLGSGVYTLAIPGAGEDLGATGDLDVRDDVAIVGVSAENTILDGGQLDRVLDVATGSDVEIHGVTIRNGKVNGPGGGVRNQGVLSLSRSIVTGNSTTGSGFGGGLWADGAEARLTITQSTVADNLAGGGGGGLATGAYTRVTDSTFSGNGSATDFGGALYVFADTDAVFSNVTVTGNSAAQRGGGIFAESSPFTGLNHPELHNAIVAGNTAAAQGDCSGAVRSGGYNLLGNGFDCIDFTAAHHDAVGTPAAPIDPKLGPLAGNGGPTPTHALLAGSPALGFGNDCTEADQRGQDRPAAGCDSGAYEQGTACITGGPTLCLNHDRFQVTAQWRKKDGTTGSGKGVSLTPDSGTFWFFDPTNVELTLKVLNACGLNQHYWVFLSGLTNVEVTVTVTDTENGTSKVYHSPLGSVFPTNLDTGAFATCP